MDGPAGTVITRDWPKTLRNAAGSVAVVIGVYWTMWRPIEGERIMMLVWPMTFVFGGVAAYFAYRAAEKSGVAKCPGCAIKFRSHAYFTAFCAANDAIPRT